MRLEGESVGKNHYRKNYQKTSTTPKKINQVTDPHRSEVRLEGESTKKDSIKKGHRKISHAPARGKYVENMQNLARARETHARGFPASELKG